MAILFPDPPEAIVAAAQDAGQAAWAGGQTPGGETGGAPRLEIQPVFTAGLDAIVANQGNVERLAKAPTSWRYATELGGAVELVADEQAETARPARAGEDRFSAPIQEALFAAQEDPRVSDVDYEARLLRVPALKLLAVWLHAASAEDLYVPVVPTTVDAAPQELYSARDFAARLREAASNTLALYEKAERPDELGG